MDSIRTNIVNAPQMSAIDFVNFADGSTWSAATYQRVIFIPLDARVCGFGVAVSDAVTTTSGSNTFTLGIIARTLLSDSGR